MNDFRGFGSGLSFVYAEKPSWRVVSEEAWHSPSFWKKVVSRVSIVGFEAFWKAGLCFLVLFSSFFCGGSDLCRAQSFIEQKASGDCFELIARCLLSSKSERDQIGAALFSLICARWMEFEGHLWGVRISAGGMFELWWGYVHSVIHLDVIFVTSCHPLFRTVNQTVNLLL